MKKSKAFPKTKNLVPGKLYRRRFTELSIFLFKEPEENYSNCTFFPDVPFMLLKKEPKKEICANYIWLYILLDDKTVYVRFKLDTEFVELS